MLQIFLFLLRRSGPLCFIWPVYSKTNKIEQLSPQLYSTRSWLAFGSQPSFVRSTFLFFYISYLLTVNETFVVIGFLELTKIVPCWKVTGNSIFFMKCDEWWYNDGKFKSKRLDYLTFRFFLLPFLVSFFLAGLVRNSTLSSSVWMDWFWLVFRFGCSLSCSGLLVLAWLLFKLC